MNNEGIGAEGVRGDAWLDNSSAFDDILASLNKSNELNQGENNVIHLGDNIPKSVPKFGRLAHRTKFIRNKQVSNFDSASINNILGKKVNSNFFCIENLFLLLPL